MTARFILTFLTDLARSRTISINNPNLSATNVSVSNAMQAMISANVVSGAGGRLATARRALLERVTVTPIDLNV